jgi:hypothetical protein
MEFTFTFAEVINKMIDLALFGMESFVAVWMFAAFVSSAYPDSSNLSTAPVTTAPVQEPTVTEPVKELMIATLLSKIEEEKIDINLLLTA